MLCRYNIEPNNGPKTAVVNPANGQQARHRRRASHEGDPDSIFEYNGISSKDRPTSLSARPARTVRNWPFSPPSLLNWINSKITIQPMRMRR